MGVRDRAHEARPRPALGDRPRGRPEARPRRGLRRDRGLEARRHAARPDRAARQGQLLAGGRDRAVRALLGDLLRPRRRARLRARRLPARLRVRPLHGVLQPRLHGIRPAPGPRARAAAEPERRHRPRPRARDVPAAGGRVGVRQRRVPADHGLGRVAVRCRLRRERGRDQGPPRARRPRPRDVVPDRRRSDPLERGPRLHLPAHHPPRRPARPADWARRGLPPRRRRLRADGRRVSRVARARRRDRARRPARGGALPRDADARPEGVRRARREGRDLRRGGIRPGDHLRLPDRVDAGARRGARPGR